MALDFNSQSDRDVQQLVEDLENVIQSPIGDNEMSTIKQAQWFLLLWGDARNIRRLFRLGRTSTQKSRKFIFAFIREKSSEIITTKQKKNWAAESKSKQSEKQKAKQRKGDSKRQLSNIKVNSHFTLPSPNTLTLSTFLLSKLDA